MKQSNIYRNILDKSSGGEGNNVSQAGQDFSIVTNPMLEQFRFLQNTYEEWKEIIEQDDDIDQDKEKLRVAEDYLEEEDYSENAVHELLIEFQGRDSSFEDPSQDIFASAVINRIGGETISVGADTVSELNGLTGLGYGNKGNVVLEGEVDEPIFNQNEAGNVNIEGDVNKRVGEEMTGGTIEINGDVTGFFGAGRQMRGGRIIVDGYAQKAGLDMENGLIEVTEGAEQLGDRMGGGEIGSEQHVETLAKSAEGGIAWVNDNAEEVGTYAKGGLIYVAGDAEEIGRKSNDGEIYIEGQIGNIGEECGADVYQWRDGEWELVHEGEDQRPRRKQGKSKSTSTSNKASQKSSETMGSNESSDDPGYTNNILEGEDYHTDDTDFGYRDEESYGGKINDAPTGLAEKVGELDPLCEKRIEEQLRDEE